MRVCAELQSTERGYLQSILTLLTHFLVPLREEKLATSLQLKATAQQAWRQCYGALEPMVKLHADVYAELATVELELPSTVHPLIGTVQLLSALASVFSRHIHFFKLYTGQHSARRPLVNRCGVHSFVACLADGFASFFSSCCANVSLY